jgi:hypothetical protein
VRIIMSPTSSSRLFAGRNARSATPLTIYLPRVRTHGLRARRESLRGRLWERERPALP